MVRVPEDYLKSVVFLCVDKPRAGGIKGRVPEATGFFVRFAEKDYLVTARHFVEETYDYHDLYIRFNKKDGEFVEVPTKRDDWPQASIHRFLPTSLVARPCWAQRRWVHKERLLRPGHIHPLISLNIYSPNWHLRRSQMPVSPS